MVNRRAFSIYFLPCTGIFSLAEAEIFMTDLILHIIQIQGVQEIFYIFLCTKDNT